MESQPQNPEFRNNPENVHPCIITSSQLKPVLMIRLGKWGWCWLAMVQHITSDLCLNIRPGP